MNKILLIDNDVALCEILEKYLTSEGYSVKYALDGEQGLKLAQKQHFDMIVLDIVLPKKNGYEVLKAIKTQPTVRTIILTTKMQSADKLIAFELGADDYLTKPCDPLELSARIARLLKTEQKPATKKESIKIDNIIIDGSKRTITVDKLPLEVTNAEFNILELLMTSPGRAFSKEELTEYALGRKYTAFDRSIDVHVSNLRNKIGNNKNGNPLIKTVRGFGYMYDNEQS